MHKLSLQAMARQLTERAQTSANGRSAETVYGGHEAVLRQTVIAMTAGTSLAEHNNPGDATVYVVSGRVRLSAGADHWEGRQGDLLLVPRARHALEALENSAVLLSVAARPNAG